eukprot:7379729-Prymnesium_polylepis.1
MVSPSTVTVTRCGDANANAERDARGWTRFIIMPSASRPSAGRRRQTQNLLSAERTRPSSKELQLVFSILLVNA